MRSNKNLLAAGMVVFFSFAGTVIVSASPIDSPWSGVITVQNLSEPISTDNSGPPMGFDGSTKQCTTMTVYLRESSKLQFLPFIGDAEITRSICAVRTPAGYVGDGYFLPTGASIAGKLIPPQNQSIDSLIAMPNNSTLVGVRMGSNGNAYVHLIPNALSGIRAIKNSDGTVQYEITQPASSRLKNSVGSELSIRPLTAVYSKNGEWIVADSENTGALRIHPATGQVFAFDTALSYNLGYNPNTQFAISDDGRFVARASYAQTVFTLHDLGSCNGVNRRAPYNNLCFKRDMGAEVKNKYPTHSGGANRLDFNGSILQFVTSYNKTSNTNQTYVKLSATYNDAVQAGVAKIDYLALGDSFASGEGVFNYKPITDTPDNRCHLSYDSYPYLLDKQLINIGATESVACSGAKIKDYSYMPQKDYNDKYMQAKEKHDTDYNDEVYFNYLPGYRTQDNFIIKNKPNIVTISMSGNDIGFGKILKSCVTSADECYKFYEDRAELVSMVNNNYAKLVDMYTSIKDNANTNARVYVIGYPLFAKPYADCAVNVRLSNDEIVFGNGLVEYLNAVIEMAATHAGVQYVDTSHAFYGSRLCETESYKVAMNGLTAGDSSGISGVGPIGSESYHPNKIGHELFAKTIRQKTNDLTAPMPTPVIGDPLKVAQGKLLFVTSAPHNDSLYLSSFYDEQVSTMDTYYVGDEIKLEIKQHQQQLQPNQAYQVWLHSDPILLGTLTTDASSQINGKVTLPQTVPPGYHTLKIIGKNISGEDISVQKIVYVGASVDDIDGDGIQNIDEQCLAGEPAAIDTDKDSLDDGCDGFISEPPLEEGEPYPPSASIGYDKELPQSESRPEWLLMKEREIAEEQAAANQSATIQATPIPVTPPCTEQTNRVSATSAETDNTSPVLEDQTNTTTPPPTTKVAGITSSAVETKVTTDKTHSSWWAYAVVGGAVLLVSSAISYRYAIGKNRV